MSAVFASPMLDRGRGEPTCMSEKPAVEFEGNGDSTGTQEADPSSGSRKNLGVQWDRGTIRQSRRTICFSVGGPHTRCSKALQPLLWLQWMYSRWVFSSTKDVRCNTVEWPMNLLSMQIAPHTCLRGSYLRRDGSRNISSSISRIIVSITQCLCRKTIDHSYCSK